jgi:hypothetical protein
MEPHAIRRGDRVDLGLPIIVTGTDAMGAGFLEQSRTIVISRHGAKILLQRKLAPDQEINVRCISTAKESDARVVGQTGADAEGYYYGVELLDVDANIWDIDFPPPEEGDVAVGRVLLECVSCHTRELAYLNEFEAEVLEVNQSLSRHCRKCTDTSVWKETHLQAGEELPAEVQEAAVTLPPPPPKRTRNDRKHVRLDLKIDVCIRHPQYGEEVTVTENVSRGGFRFRSRRHYREGWVIEAALPYSRTGANIFAAARIMYAAEEPEEGVGVYGVAYVPNKEVWDRR